MYFRICDAGPDCFSESADGESVHPPGFLVCNRLCFHARQRLTKLTQHGWGDCTEDLTTDAVPAIPGVIPITSGVILSTTGADH